MLDFFSLLLVDNMLLRVLHMQQVLLDTKDSVVPFFSLFCLSTENSRQGFFNLPSKCAGATCRGYKQALILATYSGNTFK